MHAHRRACVVRACMLIDMCACTRPMVVWTMQIHAYTRLRNSLKVHVSVRPSVRQAALGRAEAGEFGGNGVQAFEDIVKVGFLGRGLFGEE